MTGRTLTRADISLKINRKVGISQTDAAATIDAIFDVIAEGLKTEELVKVSGFGNFVVRKKKERVGRNPKTGTTAKITARKAVTFHPSLMLKKQVNS